MEIIGREYEQQIIENCLFSNRPEFLVVYGRRRVGKTYLIKEYFHNSFSFYATGVPIQKTREQLKIFHTSLVEYGCTEKTIPKDWFEAFSRLKELLLSDHVKRNPIKNKLVIFLDELPWMDTKKSDFKSALDYFWNSFLSSRPDVLLIVCGSATSWIIDHLIGSTGGFYNRITRQLHLNPFTLKECEMLYKANGLIMSRREMLLSYMIFGGIPYYLNLFNRHLSFMQNVDHLCFNESGELYYEYDRLFSSLFKNSERHILIIENLAKRKSGLTRVQLSEIKKIGNGEQLTKALSELIQCGFIRKYNNGTSQKQGHYYQLIDPFTLFCLQFLKEKRQTSWISFFNTPAFYSWCGLSFELVSLLHIEEIKNILGISGIESECYMWRSINKENNAQIDLVIDRRDDVINLVEMKFSENEYRIEKDYQKSLLRKIEVFQKETGTKKAIHLTMITANGLYKNEYTDIVIRDISAEQFFN